MFEWRRQYDLERDRFEGDLVVVDASDREDNPDRTVQSYRDDADINVLMRRFRVTGELPVSRVEPFYGDFSAVMSYQDALQAILDAEASFLELPSAVRNRFDNDPVKLVAFLADEQNADEARELGLARPLEAPPAPMDVRVINEEAGEDSPA